MSARCRSGGARREESTPARLLISLSADPRLIAFNSVSENFDGFSESAKDVNIKKANTEIAQDLKHLIMFRGLF